MQTDLYGYYGWDPLWGGGLYAGAMGGIAAPLPARAYFGAGLGFLLALFLTHGSLVAAFGILALVAGMGRPEAFLDSLTRPGE